jgi:hypothetical protein
MLPFLRARLQAGLHHAGVMILRKHITIGQAIDEILLVALCSEPDEWKDRVEFLPL